LQLSRIRPAVLCLFALLQLVAAAGRVHAYSSFADYARPIEEGGGGNKFFTGTPADGYTCDVCHTGAPAAKLDVIGLPVEGYVPGQTYQIGFQWPQSPDAIPHFALMVELTDLNGAVAGTTALVPYAQWTDAEKCAQDAFPAADICRAGAEPGCCRDLDPTRDACAFPGERHMLWMLECGARAARFDWTAPAQATDIWFSASLLGSNTNNDAAGDGVTLVRYRLRPATGSAVRVGALGRCQAQPGTGRPAGLVFALWLGALLAARMRSSRRRGYSSPVRE
jgi:hypothetical protein